MDVLRRMSLKDSRSQSKGYDTSSTTVTRTKSTSSCSKKAVSSFRARSGSFNPAAFLRGKYNDKRTKSDTNIEAILLRFNI